MTRRLAWALVAFTTVVLALSAVPLGLSTAARDRTDYAAETRNVAQGAATLAADAFDHDGRRPTAARLRAAIGLTAAATLFDTSGRPLLVVGRAPAPPASQLRRVRAGRSPTWQAHGQVVAAAPVLTDGTLRGVLVVARSDAPVRQRIARLWLGLAAVALLAFLLCLGLAVALARWVSQPLRRLGDVAHRWSDGSLHERAAAAGPPEMRDVATALNAMAARLDALVQGSRAVVADVSHQLRTPLAAMRLRLELVADELTARRGEEHEDLAVALSELERLSRLVDGLLAVARAETAETRPAIIDVARLLSERQQAWQPVADERGSEIVVHSPAGLRVSATPGHLEQVLDNLLDNALNAVASSGHVTVSATAAADRICIRVEDDGPGMTQPQQQQAFHRFLSSRTDGGGTGLGLAIVHRLVTADGGDVRLTSGPDSGTAVTIDLPAARAGR